MIAKLRNGKIAELIPEIDPMLPGISVKKRFSKEFLSECVECPEDAKLGQVYENGVFSEPVPDPENLDIPIKDADPTVRERLETLENTVKALAEKLAAITKKAEGE